MNISSEVQLRISTQRKDIIFFFMIIRIKTYIVSFGIENQFVHPSPKGSELIFPAPFRVGRTGKISLRFRYKCRPDNYLLFLRF